MNGKSHIWWHYHKEGVTRCLCCDQVKTPALYLERCPGRRGDPAEAAPAPAEPPGQVELELA